MAAEKSAAAERREQLKVPYFEKDVDWAKAAVVAGRKADAGAKAGRRAADPCEPKPGDALEVRLAWNRTGLMMRAVVEKDGFHPDGDVMIVSHAGAVGALAAEMKARSKAKVSGGTWNCALFKYAVDDAGRFRFVGYEIDFLPEEAVTANMHKIDPSKKPSRQKVKSGVDYKYDL